jgi:hypothetical protein
MYRNNRPNPADTASSYPAPEMTVDVHRKPAGYARVSYAALVATVSKGGQSMPWQNVGGDDEDDDDDDDDAAVSVSSALPNAAESASAGRQRAAAAGEDAREKRTSASARDRATRGAPPMLPARRKSGHEGSVLTVLLARRLLHTRVFS